MGGLRRRRRLGGRREHRQARIIPREDADRFLKPVLFRSWAAPSDSCFEAGNDNRLLGLEARLTSDGFDSLRARQCGLSARFVIAGPCPCMLRPRWPRSAARCRCKKGSNLVDETKALPGTSFDLIVSDRPEDVKLESAGRPVHRLRSLGDLEKLVSITKASIDVVDWDRGSPLLQHVTLLGRNGR